MKHSVQDYADTEPAHRTAHWLERDEAALAGVLPRIFPIFPERGEGAWLVDVDGRRFLDMSSGIAVTTTGHCHPRVVAAVQEQAARLIHVSVVTHNPLAVRLAERLRAKVPYLDDARVFFCNSGAEAVDGAIKLARRTTGRTGIVAFRHAFHGRTMAATSLTTAKDRYREGYSPLLPEVHVAPYCHGDVQEALRGLDAVLESAGAANVAAMIVEPVLGEGGYVVPPVEWLAGLRERCDRHGILLVFDEVQTGVGRTGTFFAAEGLRVIPDVILFAKGIASGLPMGGIIAPARVVENWPRGTHGPTFGGNLVACAAALATLDVLDEDGLCARAAVLGERARDRLRLAARASGGAVVEVRGIGLMIGVELRESEVAKRVQDRCFDAGVLVLTCGPGDNVLRLMPPLTVSDAELDLGLDALCAAIAAE
ncbi:MAG: aspartate aminotransferase family protein [Acidimicrobiia bacterium]